MQLLQTYLEKGASGLVAYDNNATPVSVRAEIEKILQNSPNLMNYNADFLRHLTDFPNAALPDVEDYFYWSKEKLLKSVVSVAQVCIQRVTRGSDTGYFIAIKHIYDSHYFLADTEFLTLVPDGSDASHFYLVDVVRARLDPPRKFRGLLLGKIKGSMKDALATDVKATRQRLEAVPSP